MNEKDALIALNACIGIGVNNFINLLERFGSAADVFSASKADIQTVEGIGPKVAERVPVCKPQEVADREKRLAEKFKTTIVTYKSERYPANLRLFHKSPPVLYIAGEIMEIDRIAIGVVGSRKPTPYGRIAGEKLSRELSETGITIVSGLARGIDSVAHKSALESGGRTIAVLGTGLDRVYPPENAKLFDEIEKRGAVVSQFSFGTEPHKMNFPIRNRIISGLSIGVLVIEAGEKSGSNITAYASLEEGREVFAVPGRIDSSMSIGPNRLIQRGAKLVTSTEDIIEELSPEVRAVIGKSEEKSRENLGLNLSTPEEGKILELLEGAERQVDYLIEKSGLPSGLVLGILLELELRGTIRQLPGKLFAKL